MVIANFCIPLGLDSLKMDLKTCKYLLEGLRPFGGPASLFERISSVCWKPGNDFCWKTGNHLFLSICFFVVEWLADAHWHQTRTKSNWAFYLGKRGKNTSVAVVLDFERLRANSNYTHEIATMWDICILFRDREFRFQHMFLKSVLDPGGGRQMIITIFFCFLYPGI